LSNAILRPAMEHLRIKAEHEAKDNGIQR
jgi:hypothetical protein